MKKSNNFILKKMYQPSLMGCVSDLSAKLIDYSFL